MKKEDNYIDINKKAWDQKTQYHVESPFYDMDTFMKGKSTLNDIELQLLGNVTGKRVLHLQCHFGQDTLSLGRMGATVTGVDFSEAAINKARQLSHDIGVPARFVCCDIYDLHNHLDEQFDIVFTSYGTIGWLPDLDKWADVVSKFLKPGGRFVFAEFHPVIWMFDTALEKVHYNYFKSDAIIEMEMGTYADITAPIESETISWNHSLSEVMNSLIDSGLEIAMFNEYDYSPYNCFNNMEEQEPGKYRFMHHGNKLPIVYSLLATKRF
jgi:SAM-dependent methyltransferase